METSTAEDWIGDIKHVSPDDYENCNWYNSDGRSWHWTGAIKHVSHDEHYCTWHNSDGRSWHWTGANKHVQEDDYEHYCTYKTQKQKLSNLLLYLLKGRQHWKGLILNLGANDCKENQEEQQTMTGYDSRNITWICCIEMIFNWNKLGKDIYNILTNKKMGKKPRLIPGLRIVRLHA